MPADRPRRPAPRRPLGPLGRAFALLGLLASAAAAIVAGRAFFSDLYLGYASDQRNVGNPLRAQVSAQLAAKLAPWRATARSLNAERRADRAGLAAGRYEMAVAIALAPADPVIWHRRARMLQRQGEFGPDLLATLRRTHELAPRARTLQLAEAIEGVFYWRHADPELQSFWLDRMRFALRRDPLPFLRGVAIGEREQFMCAYVGDELRLQRWCRDAARVRKDCQSEQVAPGQAQWCVRNGFLRKRPR